MAYAPIIRQFHRPFRRRRHLSVHPGLLAAAAILIVFATLVTVALVNGVPQLDPRAQMFVVP